NRLLLASSYGFRRQVRERAAALRRDAADLAWPQIAAATALAEIGDARDARETLLAAVQRHAGSLPVLDACAARLADAGAFEDAVAVLDRAYALETARRRLRLVAGLSADRARVLTPELQAHRVALGLADGQAPLDS